MNSFIYHFLFEFRTGIRNRTMLLMKYLFPLSFYALIGLILPQINPLFLETMIPAMVVFAILAASLLGLPDQLVIDREAGIFRNYKINGVPAISILVIPALATILHTAVVTIIITVSAPLLFNAPPVTNWPGFLITFFLTAFSCTGLGVLIGVVSLSSRMTILCSQLIFLPSMLLGGMMLPYRMLPEKIGKIAQVLPATQAMNAFRGFAQGLITDFDPQNSLIILMGSGIITFGLAVHLFRWDRHTSLHRF